MNLKKNGNLIFFLDGKNVWKVHRHRKIRPKSSSRSSSKSSYNSDNSTDYLDSYDSDSETDKLEKPRRKIRKRSDSQNKIFVKSVQAICPSFDGNNDVEQYIEQAKIYLSQIAPITESEAVKTLISQISGDARKVIKGYPREQIKKKIYIFKILKREFKKKR